MTLKHVDMADFPDDVWASLLKASEYAQRHSPCLSREDFLGLARKIGIPQEHLELILARVLSLDVELIRAVLHYDA
jgi:hypothetical protein